MSSPADEFGFYAEQLLNKSKTNQLRERMSRFVEQHGDDTELKTERADASDGTPLSEIVVESRDERV